MKHRLKAGLEPRNFMLGNKMYILDAVTYREYPENVLNHFKGWMVSEPKAKTVIDEIKTEDKTKEEE